MGTRFARVFVVAGAGALAGCAAFSPVVGPEAAKDEAYDKDPTLPHAVAVAGSMKSRYVAQIEDQMFWDRAAGLGLIGIAAIGSDLGMRGIAPNHVLGLGITGAAVYTGANWLYPAPRQAIYAAGANAVQCSLDLMTAERQAYGRLPELTENLGKIRELIGQIEHGLPALKTDAQHSAAAPGVEAALARARAILPQGEAARKELVGAPVKLRQSLSVIQQTVTISLASSAPTLDSLLASLGRAMPELGSKITGQPLPGAPVLVKTAAAANVVKVVDDAGKLVGPIAIVESIVAQVDIQPADELMKACKVDLAAANITLTAEPTSLVIEAGSPGANAFIKGGTPRYTAAWYDTVPPAELSFKLADGGLLSVEAKTGTPVGRYSIRVADSARVQGSVKVDVVVTPATAASVVKTSPTTPVEAKPACTADERVRKVQQALIAKGLKTATINGKTQEMVVDGCMGPITEAVMKQFVKGSDPIDPATIPGGNELLAAVESKLKGTP